MNNSFPTALVVGVDLMAGKELVEELIKNEINVLGIGEYVELDSRENFEYRFNIDEIDRKIDYIFDFTGNKEIFRIAKRDGSRVVLIGDEGEAFGEINWRRVVVRGCYGRGMEKDEKNEWLKQIIEDAVKNKNLTVPSRKSEIRLLPMSDWVGVIMKCCFMSGIDGERIEVWGRKVELEDLVAKLIDKAKMTRFKVMETDEVVESEDEENVVGEWRKIRWEPNEDWSIDLEKTLQYFFTLADEENRKKKGNVIRNSIDDKSNTISDIRYTENKDVIGNTINDKRKEKSEKKFEVMVEEEEENVIRNPILDIREEEEDEFEIKPIVGKKEDVISNTINDKSNTNPTPLRKLGDLPLKKGGITEDVISNTINDIREEEEEDEFEIKPLISPLPERKIIRDTINDKRNTISDIRYTENKDVIGNTINDKRKTRDWGRYVKIAVGGVAIIMILMGMLRVVNYVLAIDSWVKSLKEGKIEKIAETNKNIKLVSAKNIKTIENFGWNNSLSGRKIWKGLKMVEEGSEIVDLGIELNESGEKIGEGVFGEKEIEVIKELEISQQKLEEINKRLGVVQAKLNDDWNWIPGRWRGEINKAKKSLPEYREKISKATKMVPVLKEMLGGDGKRREYMVLFQNESELRPGGGFIGSFGILSFENGKMLGLEVKDIYEIDGQLKGHVEPPEAIKTILGEGGWYLRDANWKPNMVEASKDILWFFEKETGRRVDGLVTMNLAVAKGWLGVLGEIMVPDFKVKINKDNLYEQAEFYAETKFFPGSNQKGSFLGGLATVMMEEIKTAKGIEKLKLLETSLNLLDENEIQLVVNEKKINNILTDLGWNGMMYQGKCKSDRCVADYWYGVEANLGVNKANYFIYRNVEQQVEIGSNAVARIAKITYENSAKNSNWPGGDYKNYLRVYIPAEANVAEVSVTSNDGTKTVYGGDSLKITNNDGKKEIGLLVVVPVASKRIVEVRYNLAIDLNKENKFSYMLYQQKQSGYGDTGLVNLITVPSGWQVSQVEPAATVMNNKLLFNQKFKKDLMIGVEIEK